MTTSPNKVYCIFALLVILASYAGCDKQQEGQEGKKEHEKLIKGASFSLWLKPDKILWVTGRFAKEYPQLR